MKAALLLIVISISLFSCENLLPKIHSVEEVLEYNPRELEKMESLRVRGKMGNSINLGVLSINAFTLKDLNYPDKLIYVHTSHNTMPANKGDVIKMDLKLWKEISLGFSKFYLFEELNNENK